MKKSELKEIIIECIKQHLSENKVQINNIKIGTRKFDDPISVVRFVRQSGIDVNLEISYDEFKVGRVYSTIQEFLDLYKKNIFESNSKKNDYPTSYDSFLKNVKITSIPLVNGRWDKDGEPILSFRVKGKFNGKEIDFKRIDVRANDYPGGSTTLNGIRLAVWKELLAKEKNNIKEETKKSNGGVKLYTIKVKHDGGTRNIVTAATSEKAAKEIIMKAEGCPECAIVSVKNNIKEETNNQIGISLRPLLDGELAMAVDKIDLSDHKERNKFIDKIESRLQKNDWISLSNGTTFDKTFTPGRK